MPAEPPSTDPQTYKVNVLDRAVAILQVFSPDRPNLTLAEVSRLTGLHRSTALRLLASLGQHGMVIRNQDTGAYSLGYEILAMAETVRAGSGLSDWARPVMQSMSDRLNETVILSVRSGDHRIDIDQVVANQPIRRVVRLGEQKLLSFGASSLSLLSGLLDDQVRAILTRTDDATRAKDHDFNAEAFIGQLAAIRTQGFHEQMNQYGQGSWSGSVAVAGPIHGRRGEVVGSLGVSVPAGRWSDALRAEVIAAVRQGCAEIAARIGSRAHVA